MALSPDAQRDINFMRLFTRSAGNYALDFDAPFVQVQVRPCRPFGEMFFQRVHDVVPPV